MAEEPETPDAEGQISLSKATDGIDDADVIEDTESDDIQSDEIESDEIEADEAVDEAVGDEIETAEVDGQSVEWPRRRRLGNPLGRLSPVGRALVASGLV